MRLVSQCNVNYLLSSIVLAAQYQCLLSTHSPFPLSLPLSFSSLSLCSARKSKTHVSLLPRVVARKGESGEKEKEEGNSEETKNKMSNEDFRKLLMKQ